MKRIFFFYLQSYVQIINWDIKYQCLFLPLESVQENININEFIDKGIESYVSSKPHNLLELESTTGIYDLRHAAELNTAGDYIKRGKK